MKIACFLQGRTTPSSRFRILQYLRYFEEAGIQCDCFYPLIPKYGYVIRWLRGRIPRLILRRLTQLLIYWPHRWWQILHVDLHHYDVVIVQKRMSDWPESAYFESMISRRNPRVIFDMDDAEFVGLSHHRNHKAEHLTGEIAKFASTVVVCNGYLEAAVDHKAHSVYKFPTAADERRFFPRVSSPEKNVTIGWTGTASTIGYIRQILPILESVLEQTGAALLIISDQDYIRWLSHLPNVKFIKWNPDDEVIQLQEVDIGIMPLLDDEWTRGKCAFKLVQYMAIGIPCVASPVGMNCEVVHHGVTGYLAAGSEEWEASLLDLASSLTLRRRMGLAARQRFIDYYSGSMVAKKWIDLINKIAKIEI